MSLIDFINKPHKIIVKINEVLEPYFDKIELLILFGSIVDGSMTTQSDIDILVVCRDNSMKKVVIDILSTLGMNLGLFFDVTYVDQSLYEHYEFLPVIREAREDGIIIWEKKKI